MPPSYATAEQARAYVARVLSRPRPKPPRVYLIAPAGSQKSRAWPKVMRVVRALLRGAEAIDYHQMFPHSDSGLEDRVARIAAELSGALVITRRWTDNATGAPPRYLTGYAARQEADALAELGVPVLVLAPGGTVAWPDVRAHRAEGTPRWLPIEIDLPAPPPGAILPTVAASYRALGIAPPRPAKPRNPQKREVIQK